MAKQRKLTRKDKIQQDANRRDILLISHALYNHPLSSGLTGPQLVNATGLLPERVAELAEKMVKAEVCGTWNSGIAGPGTIYFTYNGKKRYEQYLEGQAHEHTTTGETSTSGEGREVV